MSPTSASQRYGYDAIEICPPKGRYGLGVSMEDYLATHKQLKADFGLEVSNVNECWGEMWDPYSPDYKTLTEPATAELAVSETRSTIDFAAELGAMSVTIATAIHAPITADNVDDATAVAVDSLRRMGEHAATRGIKLVFEATNHLEMGKFINTASNHKRIIELTGRDNIGIQLDFFHVNLEELGPYEAVMDAQPYLWHGHFRDSNSLTPGYGKTDWYASHARAHQDRLRGLLHHRERAHGAQLGPFGRGRHRLSQAGRARGRVPGQCRVPQRLRHPRCQLVGRPATRRVASDRSIPSVSRPAR